MRISMDKENSILRIKIAGTIESYQLALNVSELGKASRIPSNKGILIDTRKAVINLPDMESIFQLANLFNKETYACKIANLVPDNIKRLESVRQLQICLDSFGISYNYFTESYKAYKWLKSKTA